MMYNVCNRHPLVRVSRLLVVLQLYIIQQRVSFFCAKFRIYSFIASKRLGTAQIKYLKNMTPEQVAIIREFLREPTHTLPLPMNNGLVIELQHLQILTPAGQTHLVSMLDPQINYFLQPWVIKKINSDEELKRIFY